MSQRALLLVNPHARQGEAARSQVIQQLQQQGFELVEESGEDPQRFPDLIRHYHQEINLVIIGGGDGSVNAAVPGLLDTNLPLGILPLGTANNLARTLKIPPSVSETCHIIAEGQVQRIDLGWVNTDGERTTKTPAQFRVLPHRLSVFMPSSIKQCSG